MTILNLTFLRSHEEKDSEDRPDLEPGHEASSRVLSRLERLLAKESSAREESPATTGRPGDLVSAHARNDEVEDVSLVSESMASEDVSAVSVMAPPEEVGIEPLSALALTDDTMAALASLGLAPETSQENVEVRLIAALSDACADGEAPRLAEQARGGVRHESSYRLERLENELADAVGKVQTEAALRRSVELELERVQGEARRLAKKVQTEAGLRRAAELELERVQGEARCLAEQARDRVQLESRHQLASLEAELAAAVEKVQTEAVLLRAADVELERAQEESTRRVAEVEVRLDRLMADVSMATRETTTTTEVKRTTSARKPRKARKPAAVARKTRSDTKAVPARKSKTVKTSAAGTKRKAIAEVKRMKSASKKTRSATLTVPARRSKTLTTSPAGTKRRAIA